MPGTGPLTAAVDTLSSGMVYHTGPLQYRERGGKQAAWEEGGGPNERGGGGADRLCSAPFMLGLWLLHHGGQRRTRRTACAAGMLRQASAMGGGE